MFGRIRSTLPPDASPAWRFDALGRLLDMRVLAVKPPASTSTTAAFGSSDRPPTGRFEGVALFGAQFTLIGMWFDQESNKELR